MPGREHGRWGASGLGVRTQLALAISLVITSLVITVKSIDWRVR